MKTLIVTSIQVGKEKTKGAGALFMSDYKGTTIKVRTAFAESNGINKDYRGPVQYTEESHKKGEEFIGKDGVKGTYFDDCVTISSIKAMDFTAYKNGLEAEILEKKMSILSRQADQF